MTSASCSAFGSGIDGLRFHPGFHGIAGLTVQCAVQLIACGTQALRFRWRPWLRGDLTAAVKQGLQRGCLVAPGIGQHAGCADATQSRFTLRRRRRASCHAERGADKNRHLGQASCVPMRCCGAFAGAWIVRDHALLPLLDTGPDQPPVHRVGGYEAEDHGGLHHEPELDRVDRRLGVSSMHDFDYTVVPRRNGAAAMALIPAAEISDS
jgi:hypothetical protein